MLRLIGGLVIVAAIGLGIAWYFNWITFSVQKTDGGTDVKVGVNRDRIQKDVKGLQERFQNAKSQEVRGKIAVVEADKKLVSVQHDGGTIELRVPEGTQIQVGEREGRLADLQAGMRVTASYVVEGEQKTARSVRVETP